MRVTGLTAQKIELVLSEFGPTSCSQLKMSEIILMCHNPLRKFSNFASRLTLFVFLCFLFLFFVFVVVFSFIIMIIIIDSKSGNIWHLDLDLCGWADIALSLTFFLLS